MNKNKHKFLESFLDFNEPNIFEKIWWKIELFFEEWIYPGYFLRNMLFHHYNIIKLPGIKPYEYTEVCQKLELGNFELLREFLEDYKPEKYIEWYGENGHQYGEGDKKILFPELKGKYVMDLLKEIYDFYFKKLPILREEADYLLEIWSNYHDYGHWEVLNDDVETLRWIFDESPWTFETIEKENLKWDIIEKYIKKEEILNDEFFVKIHQAKIDIENKITYYLHLFIELREYLWT